MPTFSKRNNIQKASPLQVSYWYSVVFRQINRWNDKSSNISELPLFWRQTTCHIFCIWIEVINRICKMHFQSLKRKKIRDRCVVEMTQYINGKHISRIFCLKHTLNFDTIATNLTSQCHSEMSLDRNYCFAISSHFQMFFSRDL